MPPGAGTMHAWPAACLGSPRVAGSADPAREGCALPDHRAAPPALETCSALQQDAQPAPPLSPRLPRSLQEENKHPSPSPRVKVSHPVPRCWCLLASCWQGRVCGHSAGGCGSVCCWRQRLPGTRQPARSTKRGCALLLCFGSRLRSRPAGQASARWVLWCPREQ